MNKKQAKDAVAGLTAWSLRRLAEREEQWEKMPLDPQPKTEHQRKMIRQAMLDLADRLKKEPVTHDQQPA